MPSATMTSKGQLTVPKQVRESLGLQPGDRVDFQIEDGGKATIQPASKKAGDVFGMLSAYAKGEPVSVEEMDENLRKALRGRKP